jgi:hypothetical protein
MTTEPNIPSITKTADGVLSILDKIATLRISLLLFSLALAAEITLLQNGLGGFLHFQWDLIKDSLSMGPVILFLIGYALFMSIGVSIIKHIAEAIFSTPAYKLAHSGRADGNAWFENPAPSFKVSSTALRAYALREKDAVAMKVYNDSVLERNE